MTQHSTGEMPILVPSLPKRPCAHPGCRVLVFKGRCPKHDTQHRAQVYAEQDSNRGTSTQRGYDAAWRAVRRQYLEHVQHRCSEPGCPARATEVDHVQSVRERPDLRLSWSNLRAFCKPHHSARTMRDQVNAARHGNERANATPKGEGVR